MPKPRKNEEQDSFVTRCMVDKDSLADFPDDGQRLAFCMSSWDNRDRAKSMEQEKDLKEDTAVCKMLIKEASEDDDDRTFTGIATSIKTDRHGDIVEAEGAKFELPIPLLWMHNHSIPIGDVYAAKVTKDGIEVKARLRKIDGPRSLKDQMDRYWAMIKNRLVRGLSIGFRSSAYEFIDTGVKFNEWEWLELSAVTIPANPDGKIEDIKGFPTRARESVVKLNPKEGTMNIAEQIKQFEEKRAALAAQRDQIMNKAAEEGRSLDAEEENVYEEAVSDLAAVDKHLGRLYDMEKSEARAAKDVRIPANASEAQSKPAGEKSQRQEYIRVQPNVKKGQGFARYAIALAAAKGNPMLAERIAQERWPDDPRVLNHIKASVGTTTNSTWAAPLAEPDNLAAEFVELLRPMTLLGKLTNLREVPFNVKIPVQTGGSTVGWVGQNGPKPVSDLSFDQILMQYNKVAGIVVISEELARLSSPSAEAVVQRDLTEQVRQFLDVQFVDPAVAPVVGVNPGSITNGITPIPSAGPSANDLRCDIKNLMACLRAGNLSTSGATIIMSEDLATSISLLTNGLGQPEFSGITAEGGTLVGVKVVTSQNVPEGVMILVKESEILMADDGSVTLDASREATLELSATPNQNGPATFSLWQHNAIGIRAERWITWQRRRPEAVCYITGADYGDCPSV